MIRKSAGEDFLLITQIDHALLAERVASHFGNQKFARAAERASCLQSIGLHDQGWSLHDDLPTLNASGLPLDVFEAPRPLALRIWCESAQRASDADPYSGLLVSLHSLSLSIYATTPAPGKLEKFDVQKMHEQFAVNKFQHREVERQETLRRKLGFNTHLPLKHGIADAHASPEDDRIRFDFRLLQAMDLISLGLCCTNLPTGETGEVLPNPEADPVKLKMRRSSGGVLHVDPWPFDVNRIDLPVPCKRVQRRSFESVEMFREIYRNAEQEKLEFVVARA